jgi:aldehyde:ferredoxin oxidoreductase
MGSKNLKAIVARGSRRPPIHDRQRLLEAGERWRTTLLPMAQTTERKRGPGAIASSWGTITKHNWRSTILTDETRGFDKNRIVLRPCFACPRMCPWDVEIGEGAHQGKLLHRAPGTETLDAFYNLGIGGNDNLYLTERMDDLGIECGHFSNTAALAFEAWEKGLLGPDRTAGLELTWGNVEAADRLLDICARRDGWLGNLMADGPRELAEGLGGDALNWAVHVKGGTPGQHDWRPSLAFMIRELVASGGMKSQGGGSGVKDFGPSPDLQYREKWGPLDPTKPDGWAHNHLVSEQFKQFVGCMGACWFAMNNMAPDGLNSMVDSLAATTGWDLTMDEALQVGHRSLLLQGIFGSQRGWTAVDDWRDVGPRFLEPIPDGQYQGFTIATWLPGIIEEYHRLAGRHAVSGRPLKATLDELGMEEFAEWSEPWS